jgi:hypothetical protein
LAVKKFQALSHRSKLDNIFCHTHCNQLMLSHDGRSCWLPETSLLLYQPGALRRRIHRSIHFITHELMVAKDFTRTSHPGHPCTYAWHSAW